MAHHWNKNPKRGKYGHDDNEASTSRVHIYLSIEEKRAHVAKECFCMQFDMEEIQAGNTIEEKVLYRRRKTREDEIIQEASRWVVDPGNPRTKDTNYFRMVESYWMNKSLVAQEVNETR
jgi:hypothetical protein